MISSGAPPYKPSRPPTVRTVLPVLLLCWMAVFFDGMDANIYGAVMPYMLDDTEFGLTTESAGTIGSWTTFGMLIGALITGTLTDRLGRRPILVASVTLFSLGSAVCALGTTPGLFGVGRFVAGLGLGGLMPVCLTMVMEFAPPRRAALVTGMLMTSYHAGGMVATALGLGLAPSAGWRMVFWTGVLPAVIAVPLLLKLLPESPRVLLVRGDRAAAQAVAERYALSLPGEEDGQQTAPKSVATALRGLFRPQLRWATPLLWLASFCGLLLVYGVSTWLPQLMRASGYGLTSSVSFLLVVNAGAIVGMFIAGRTADRFGAVRVAAIWFVLTAVGALLLKSHLPLGVTYVVVFLTGVVLFSAQVMVYAATKTVYRDNERAVGLGWVTGLGRTGAVVGPWLAGVLAAGGHQGWGFTAFALAGLLGATAITLVPLAVRLCSRRPTASTTVTDPSTPAPSDA